MPLTPNTGPLVIDWQKRGRRVAVLSWRYGVRFLLLGAAVVLLLLAASFGRFALQAGLTVIVDAIDWVAGVQR